VSVGEGGVTVMIVGVEYHTGFDLRMMKGCQNH